MDGITLSKVLPLLIYPLGLAVVGGLLALVLLLFRRFRSAWFAVLFSVAVLCTAGNPLLARHLIAELEFNHLPISVEDSPSVDAVVLLGGALGLKLPPRVTADLSGSADRVLHAARLYRAGKAPIVIVTGGNVFPQANAQPESFYIAELLQEWGVPRDAIVIEGNSRNTFENARETKRISDALSIGRVLLVTSALHMPRALAVFRSAGLNTIPSVTDFWSVQQYQPRALDWLPQVDALMLTTLAIREHLGIWVYRWRGWIKEEQLD